MDETRNKSIQIVFPLTRQKSTHKNGSFKYIMSKRNKRIYPKQDCWFNTNQQHSQIKLIVDSFTLAALIPAGDR